MEKIQRLYEKINPKTDPDTMAENIIAITEEKRAKKRRPMKLAMTFAAAAVVITAATVTAGAASGADLGEVFKSFFNTGSLNAAGILEYEKLIEFDDYDVKINGFAADNHTLCVYYDVTYKDESFFKDGKLIRSKYEDDGGILNSPVYFNARPQIWFGRGLSGGGRSYALSENENTVSYVDITDSFSGFLKAPISDKFPIILTYTCYDKSFFYDETEFNALCDRNSCEPVYIDVPASKCRALNVNREIVLPDGSTDTLRGIIIDGLSIQLHMSDCTFYDYTSGRPDRYDMLTPKLIFRDGSVKDLSCEKNPGAYGVEDGNDYMYYYYSYKSVIDYEDLEAVEILGIRFEL